MSVVLPSKDWQLPVSAIRPHSSFNYAREEVKSWDLFQKELDEALTYFPPELVSVDLLGLRDDSEFNVKNEVWGISSTDRRGSLVKQFINEKDFDLWNEGTPTRMDPIMEL
ncbi:hypothetical protein SK128_006225, partial [Halocaridina rubra]